MLLINIILQDIEGIDPVGHVIGQTSLSAHSTKVKAESLVALCFCNLSCFCILYMFTSS